MKVDTYGWTTWWDKDGGRISRSHIPSIGKDILEEGGSVLTRGQMDVLFDANWTPPDNMTVPDALRLIHRGLLIPSLDYNKA
jgi:hypothetical protein